MSGSGIVWRRELYGRSLLTLGDLSNEELLEMVGLARALKARKQAGIRGSLLERKQIALVFEKSSTRTRAAATVAMRDEGGHAEYLTRSDIHFGAKESVSDTARVLGRFFDGILFRGFSQRIVETLASDSGVPVWNGLTDETHPTQTLADLMTIEEYFGRLKGIKAVYVGDGRNNVAHSLMLGCAMVGLEFVNCTPRKLQPRSELVDQARRVCRVTGGSVQVSHEPLEAVQGANVLYTDVWVSMGEEAQREQRLRLLRRFQVNASLVDATGQKEENLLFLHCLPAFHDDQTDFTRELGALEVTDEIFHAPFSRVFDQAENRMHTMKALFVSALSDTAG